MEQLRLLRRGAMRMLQRQLAMAWNQWQTVAAQMKAEREALDKAMRKFLNQKMFAAWNQWRAWAAEMRRQQYMMKGAVKRMQLRWHDRSSCWVEHCVACCIASCRWHGRSGNM